MCGQNWINKISAAAAAAARKASAAGKLLQTTAPTVNTMAAAALSVPDCQCHIVSETVHRIRLTVTVVHTCADERAPHAQLALQDQSLASIS